MSRDETATDAERAAHFVLEIGHALHRYGSPAHRLEASLGALSEKLGTEGQFLSTPTSIMAAFGPPHAQRTHLIRVDPGEVDLGRQAECDMVIRDVLADTCTVKTGLERIRAIVDAPPRYGAPATVLGFGMASSAAAAFFEGGWWDLAVAGGIGLLIGALAAVARRYQPLSRVFETIATLIATVAAMAAGAYLGDVSPFVCILAGVIVLLPGLTLTVALTELATRNLVSGTARLMGALLVFLQIGFGIAVGSHIGDLLPPADVMSAPDPLPAWASLTAVLVGGIGFTVVLRGRVRDFGWILAAIALALAGARLGAHLLGPELGAFGGALVVCGASNIRARLLDVPSSVTIIPGVIMLVPGSIGFRSMSAFLERDVISAVDTAFTMSLVAVSLVAGILLANVLVRPRRAL
jgi:uncharacterized membrane protein YjjP (DUF1212 family)